VDSNWVAAKASSGRPIDLRTDAPHPARMYDFMLGGKDNFAADRAVAEQGVKLNPYIRTSALQNRAFLRRVVGYLAAEAGIRQFLDIGTGLPTTPNVHEVAQSITPEARVVYVDNDPIVLTHARALLTSSSQGRTEYIDADLRDVDRILDSPELRATLDLGEPVALLLIAVLHLIPDDDQPGVLVNRLLDALPRGSYLALTHLTADFNPEAMQASAARLCSNGVGMYLRSCAEIEGFFGGLDLVEPGVRSVTRWRPDPDMPDAEVSVYAGVARKP
jgi:hypothetical protein